jgi:hypothetical protein
MRSSERPSTPAQIYAGIAGMFLLALGVLSLIFESVGFGTVGPAAAQPEFLIWSVSGWTAVLWTAVGASGLLAMLRLSSARTFAMAAGVLFATVAVWGFVDGNDVAGLLVADVTNNVTHVVLAVVGLIAGLLPREAQRPPDDSGREYPVEREMTTGRIPAGRW